MPDATFQWFGDRRKTRFHRQIWDPILKQWGQEIDRFYQLEKDYPFDYGERPQMGILTAAILRAWENSITLVDYGCDKKRRNTRKGRVDLWTKIKTNGQTKNGTSYLLEGKYTPRSVSGEDCSNLFTGVQRMLTNSICQAKGYREIQDYTVGAVFVSLRLNNDKNEELKSIIAAIEVITEEARDRLKRGHYGVQAQYYKTKLSDSKPSEHIGVSLFLSFKPNKQ